MTLRWHDIAARLAAAPAGARLTVPRPAVEHPLDGGLRRTLAWPVGQRADFMWERLHVQDFGGHYEARLVGDPPPAGAAGAAADAGTAAGALLGLLLCGTREATLVAAIFGAALARRGNP